MSNPRIEIWGGQHGSPYYADVACNSCDGNGLAVAGYNDVIDCPECKGYGFFTIDLIDPNELLMSIL